MQENVLIIFASGGSGLKQAAEAKKQEILLQNPHAKVIKKDLLLDWIKIPFGYLGAKAWDYSQKKGDIAKLEKILSGQIIADFVFWPRVFFKAFRLIIKENITRVIDTQPVCTAAIIKAIRLANHLKGKNIFLEKVVVDLPTNLNVHFFKPIKRLSHNDRSLLRVYTVDPLLNENETKQEFWLRNCNLPLEQVIIQKYFIRQAFKKYLKSSNRKLAVTIKAKCHHKNEILLTESVLKNRGLNYKKEGMDLNFDIKANDKVHTILLGSQPAHLATIAYLEGFLRIAKQAKNKSRHIIFIFCSKLSSKKKSLFQTVCDFTLTKNNCESLIIIPLSFQNEETIAAIFNRSDVTLTRSGGQTVMELMGVMRGKIFIHSEVKGEISREKLLKGMFSWESGSAQYLEKKHNATITTPKTFEKDLRKYF